MLLKKKFVILETVLCIALIKCLLLRYALADDVTKYYFQSKNVFKLQPEGGNPSKATLHITAELNTKPHPKRANTFIAAFKNVEVQLVMKGRIERVHICKDFKKIASSFELPFLINKTKKNALFRSVTVLKNDHITSKIMKRMVGIKFQLNEGEVRKKKEFPNLSVERTNYGICRVNYAAKQRSDRGDDWMIYTNYSRSSCDDRKYKTNPDSEYLKSFCNTDPENKLAFEENRRTTVNLTGDTLTYKLLSSNSEGSYYPYKKTPNDKFFQYIDSSLSLARNNEGDTVPDFNERNGQILLDNLYVPVTRRRISDGYQSGLRNVYKALACESEYYSFFFAMMDQAVRCFE